MIEDLTMLEIQTRIDAEAAARTKAEVDRQQRAGRAAKRKAARLPLTAQDAPAPEKAGHEVS